MGIRSKKKREKEERERKERKEKKEKREQTSFPNKIRSKFFDLISGDLGVTGKEVSLSCLSWKI